MSESTEKTTKPRSTKLRIYVTTDGSGRTLARHRATSSSQAQSFYTKQLVTRECTDDEIFDIAKNDRYIGGLPKADDPGLLGQQALLDDQGRAHDPGIGIQDQDHASETGRTERADEGFEGNRP